MVTGVVGFPVFRHWMGLLPPMIFMMLFFTFCKINPLDLRLHRWHWVVLVVQMGLSALTYLGLSAIPGLSPEIAQGLMLCFLMPTATAAPIIAGKLGGSIQNLTTFTILSNIVTAVIVPATFPAIHPEAGLGFATASWMILCKVGPLLTGPFVAAWLLRLGYDGWQKRKKSEKRFELSHRWAQCPFYLWAGTLVILMADITHTLLYGEYEKGSVIWLCVGALVSCMVQYLVGRRIGWRYPAPNKGKDYQDVVINPATAPKDMRGISRITASQAFGQKNTTLGIWMAQTYLIPISSLAPAAYIIWQNAFNSWQLREAAKRTL